MSSPATDRPTDLFSTDPDDGVSFESALAGLEAIVRELETGEISLEESLARYEKGVGLLKRCYAQLRQAEQKIVLLAGEDAEGKPLAQAFDHAPALAGDRPDPRRRARKPDSPS
jgi:exodeoxyribonuclease VII small subunit